MKTPPKCAFHPPCLQLVFWDQGSSANSLLNIQSASSTGRNSVNRRSLGEKRPSVVREGDEWVGRRTHGYTVYTVYYCVTDCGKWGIQQIHGNQHTFTNCLLDTRWGSLGESQDQKHQVTSGTSLIMRPRALQRGFIKKASLHLQKHSILPSTCVSQTVSHLSIETKRGGQFTCMTY